MTHVLTIPCARPASVGCMTAHISKRPAKYQLFIQVERMPLNNAVIQ